MPLRYLFMDKFCACYAWVGLLVKGEDLQEKKKKAVAFSSIKLSKQIYCDNKTTELVKSMPDMSV